MKQCLVFVGVLLLFLSTVSFSQWEMQNSGVNVSLWDVSFVDVLHGWAIGDSATIIATTDGGETWEKQTCPVDAGRLEKIQCVNKDVGYIVGRSGTILSTKDGGHTWVRNESGVDYSLWDLSFVNEDTGWVAGNDVMQTRRHGVILHTTNGGQSWEIQFETYTPDYFSSRLFQAVKFIDAENGWALASDYVDNFSLTYVYSTSDGGQNWNVISSVGTPLFEMSIAPEDTIWARGFSIVWSCNGGVDWEWSWDIDPSVLDIAQINGRSGWMVTVHSGDDDKIIYTDNLWTTFTEILVHEDIGLRALANIGKNYLWAVGESGVVMFYMGEAGFETEVVQGYLVTAPNGNRLWTKIIQPRQAFYPGQSFPAVVDVSGGLGFGENGNLHLAQDGFVEFHFNPEGRGTTHPSDGEEDYNGFIHQDDLKAVIEFAYTRPNVIQDNIGVMTHSYGITMGAGCLGRYPDLTVKYLIDVEGPSESFVTCHEPWSLDEDPTNDKIDIAYNNFGHYSTYRDPSPVNIAFWEEREATRFIGNMRCRYMRVQAEWDHAQPPNAQWPGFDYPPLWYPCKHAIDLVNLGTFGMSPWTKVNGLPIGNPPNYIYSRADPPHYYSGAMRDHEGEQQLIVREMAMMPARITTPGDVNGDGEINVIDAIITVNLILYLSPHPTMYEWWAADMNEDEDINILDVVLIVNEIISP